MKIKLTPAELDKKALGLCIIPGCDKSHGLAINICYSHKHQRNVNSKSGQEPTQLAYNEYCGIQLRHEQPVISFDKWKEQHTATA